ncbi:MAG: GMC oxidoreductase [Janthinobacterium lividum]
MKHDLAAAPFQCDECFDVCIIGAGAAGIVLAVQLLRAGRRIALVESGGEQPEAATQELLRSHVAGQHHSGIHEGRVRAWGGTTTRWGGQVLPLEPIDFAVREWIPRSGWPIDPAKLQTAYDTALALEGLSGALKSDDAVWKAAGAMPPELGPALQTYFTRWCPQPNFALLHGKELDSAAGLTVLLHANVVDLQVDDITHRVQKAVFRSLNGHAAHLSAREFVLAVGTIETSRLLLNFANRYGTRWNPNGLVGCHFQDHIDCEVGSLRAMNSKRFASAFTNIVSRGYKYHPKFRLTAQEQQGLAVLNVAGTIVFRDSTEEVAGEVKATGRRLLRRAWGEIDGRQIVNLLKQSPLLVRQTWTYLVKHRVYNNASAALTLRVHCEQQPNGASRITLGEDVDALGMRRARLAWQISDLELKTIRAFAEHTAEALQASGLAEANLWNDLYNDEALRARCNDGLHHIGGTVMSEDPALGVVDTDLRLHGTPNLSICSASVFSTGGFSNPTHTVLALAVRLAERLARA